MPMTPAWDSVRLISNTWQSAIVLRQIDHFPGSEFHLGEELIVLGAANHCSRAFQYSTTPLP